jgi:hypothetical protein
VSANETVHVSATGGQKAGNDERYDLIPAEPLRRLAIHAGTTVFGARGGSYHQMMCHAWAFWAGEDVDQQTDWVHLIAAAWEAFCIVQPDWRPPTGVLDDRRPGAERYDRIPPDALRQLARHFGVGARKYDDDNWTRGYDWRLTFAAANRHAWQWFAGETHDPETGSHHLIAFAWHMLVLDEFTRINRHGDTRYCTKVRAWLEAERAWNNRPRNHITLHGFCTPEEWAAAINRREQLAAATPREPRVVDTLGETERGAEWTDCDGDRWRWVAWEPTPINDHPGIWELNDHAHGGQWEATQPGYTPGPEHAPYTETPRSPRELRVVNGPLTDEHRDAAWFDAHGNRWEWRDHSHGAGWVIIGPIGYPIAGWRLRTVTASNSPFIEVLA